MKPRTVPKNHAVWPLANWHPVNHRKRSGIGDLNKTHLRFSDESACIRCRILNDEHFFDNLVKKQM